MWRLAVSSEAELEIFEAALRYERERTDLGFRFEAQVNRLFTRLEENPFQFPAIEEGGRRALVRDFPYGVFFTVEGDIITVLAVLHMHRHPDTWHSTGGLGKALYRWNSPRVRDGALEIELQHHAEERANPGVRPTEKFSARRVRCPAAIRPAQTASARRALVSRRRHCARRTEGAMDRRIVIEQREKHDDALDDR